MKLRTITWGLLLAGCMGLAAACGQGGKPADNTSKEPAKITRPEVAEEYQGKTMPEGASAEEGKKLFTAQCVSCHGETGDGETQMGKALKPPAGNLTDAKLHDAIGDDYIFWRVSEGGGFAPFKSAMTPFKNLSEEQRWHLVAYVRSLKK